MQGDVIHDGGNQVSGEATVTKQPSVSTLTEGPSTSSIGSVYLKETSGAHTFQKCTRNVHAVCGHSTQGDDDNDVESYGAS
ncbi:integrase core domain protein [Plakobranchus ocellatus]|uniref:Integrase core domain protein n=1 Tax=Plakobranchus ocellatus TaxID=259542 RepID=A0AAV4A7F0_9GAST|nr:integrase core domain protein [Plakobranchus ocellatus]